MSADRPSSLRRRLLALAALGLGLSSPLAAGAPAANSGTPPAVVAVGYGILATPMSVLGEVMRRDRILQAEGRAIGIEFSFQPFEKGSDALPPLLAGQLDAAMPTDVVVLEGIARGDIELVGYVRQSFSAVVGPRNAGMASLKGKRIGNAPGTSGHHTLLQGLAAVGLAEKDVKLVSMNVRDMPEALLADRIDAFAAFEPTPSMVLKKYPGRYAALHRQISPAYFVIDRKFAAARPEAARLLIASLYRSVHWLARSRANLDRASQWTLAGMRSFTGQEQEIGSRDIAALTRSDLLDIAGVPSIPAQEGELASPLGRSYEFLMKSGRLPAELAWKRVQDSIDRDLGQAVLVNPKRFRLGEFSFAE